jgi:hypothetical protein
MWCWKRAAARIIGATRWRHWRHRVRLIPPQYVKPLVKRGKNDRPAMIFVPVNTVNPSQSQSGRHFAA